MKKLLTALLAIAMLVSPVLAQSEWKPTNVPGWSVRTLVSVVDNATVKSGIEIPPSVLASRFGAGHTFKLLSGGPNPIFTRAGYTFRVESFGYILSDEYYYKVPVYVDFDKDNNMYRIYSTKEGMSIGLTVLTGPNKSSYVLPNGIVL